MLVYKHLCTHNLVRILIAKITEAQKGPTGVLLVPNLEMLFLSLVTFEADPTGTLVLSN